MSLWKTKHQVPGSAFSRNVSGKRKIASVIDNELWVFAIDATNATDIFTAVSIAKEYYKVSAGDILCDVYVKNLNAERENEMENKSLIRANQELYSAVGVAIMAAAKKHGVLGQLNLWVFSNSKNPKIPKDDLQQSLRDSGAAAVTTDDKTKHKFFVGSNDGRAAQNFKTNLHLATFKL